MAGQVAASAAVQSASMSGQVDAEVRALRLRAELAESRVKSLELELQVSWEDMQAQITANEARRAELEDDFLRQRNEWLYERQELLSKLSARSRQQHTASTRPRMHFH